MFIQNIRKNVLKILKFLQIKIYVHVQIYIT